MNAPDIKTKLHTYAISDLAELPGRDLVSFAASAARAGIDFLQIREKHLTDRELIILTRKILDAAAPSPMKIMVNDRVDIALASGAHGVHTGVKSVSPSQLRKTGRGDLIVAFSAHSLEEALFAQAEGADFITFSPIFFTESKARYGPPVGKDKLLEVLNTLEIPVFALGGINKVNSAELFVQNLYGIAAISLFQNSDNLPSLVKAINNRSMK